MAGLLAGLLLGAAVPASAAPRKKPTRKTAAVKPAPAPTPSPKARTSKVLMIPPATPVVPVTETLHGVTLTDPYRWLENDDAPEVRAWVDAQNGYTQAMLNDYPGREAVRQRLTELLRIGVVSAPKPRGSRYFLEKRDGEQNQPVLYVREGLRGAPRVLIDPNAMSRDSTTALDWWYPSNDGRRVAYGTSRNGDEWSTLRIRDTETGSDLPDAIPNTRAASVAWEPGGEAFYYTRYPARGSVPAGEEMYNRRVFRHVIGTPAETDSMVFGEGRRPEDWPHVSLSKDGRWLLVSVSVGWTRTDLYVRDLSDPGAPWTAVVEGVEAIFNAEVVDDTLFIATNLDAPRFRLMRAPAAGPVRVAWQEVIPQSDAMLQSVSHVGGRIFAQYLKNASSVIHLHSGSGVFEKEIALPELGTAGAVTGEVDGAEAFFTYSSYIFPPSVYRYDLVAGSLELHDRVNANVDPSPYDVEQVWYMSKDGTFISMFLAHRRGLKLDGTNPTLLHGYGGFNVALTPAFQRNSFLWLERGGVLAVANLRGGSEYGESWHQAGILDRKQTVIDDFIAAAEFLVNKKYTTPSRLCIQGGSNGGLLVGAALVQRPDLFRAVVCQVPLLDMIRYHRFLVARLWIPEYGTADDPAQFQWLMKYSPYQNVKDGTPYPAVFIDTAESDSRVAPLHARKMAARLQAASTSGHPVLLRLETKAGHGAGKPVTKLIDQYTDMWSFVFMQLGIAI
jgi:prolyl oligopeptidase